MRRLLLRPKAKADLANIWRYIAERSDASADAFIDKIDAKLQVLANNPMIGTARDGLGHKIRSYPVGRYLIFYVPLTDGIDIIRVLHGARDVTGPMLEKGKPLKN